MSSSPLDRTPNADSEFGFQLSIYTLSEIPELTTTERFRFSAEDVWRWVQTIRSGFNEHSLTNKVMKRDIHNAKYHKKNGLPETQAIQIRSLCDHTNLLRDRLFPKYGLKKDPFEVDLELPISPESPLKKGVAVAALKRLEFILWFLVSTDRHAKRNFELYKLACSLRYYAETLRGIIGVADGLGMRDDEVKDWAGEKSQDLSQCQDEIARISVVAWPESVRSDWREVVATSGTEASKLVRTLLDVCGENITSNWVPDQNSVKCIRHVECDIQKWSETFSIQADESPAVATGKPTVKRDAPAGKSKGRVGRPGIADLKRPEAKAQLNIYELIRKQKQAEPKWGAQNLFEHFNRDNGFKLRVKEAGLKFGVKMFRAALDWIKSNPTSQETQSGKVS